MRILGMVCIISWLTLCIVLPAWLNMPLTDQQAIVPLPIGPVGQTANTTLITPRIAGYSAYVTDVDDTLESIALQGGSNSTLIQAYNLVTPPLRPEQPLIVPHLAGNEHTFPELPLLVVRGNPEHPRVALTLDAGAGSEPTPSILQTLRERDIQITFFLTGRWIEQNPELARQIVNDGHEIANHSLTHADFTTLSEAEQIAELAATERLMREITGVSTRPYFRPPYGAYNNQVLLTVIERGYLPIFWTLDSLDSVGEPKTPAFLVERVTATLPPEELNGAIILAHCGSPATAEALPVILDRFAAMGVEVHPLSTVLGH